MDYLKRETLKEIGPGGIKCPCCGPKPGKKRKELRRRARRRAKIHTTDIKQEIADEKSS